VATIEEAALTALHDLEGLGHGCALVGGLAVGVRAEPRTTLDVDFAVAVESDAQAEAIVHAFQRRGYALYDVVEQVATERLATARFHLGEAAGSSGSVDLLFASSGIEPEVVDMAEAVDVLPRLTLPVAQRGHLIALKVLAHDEDRRPQDRIDILALLGVADAGDLRIAREAVALITTRGFHRDKDLGAELELFVRRAGELRGGC
jgi:predicted nucleotidyltransferase